MKIARENRELDNFGIMKTKQRKEADDFEQLIGEAYLGAPYRLTKQIMQKTQNSPMFAYPGRKQALRNVYEKEYYYRRGKYRQVVKWIVDIISQNQTKTIGNEHKYKCEQENVLAHLKEADHKNYTIFMRNMEEKQKREKQGSQTPSTVRNKEKKKAAAPGREKSTDVKPPPLKVDIELSKMSSHNLDGIYDDSSMDKSKMEGGSSETTPNKNRIGKAGTSGKPKEKQKKPDMKEYLERRAQIFREGANKKGQKLDIEQKLKKEREAAKQAPRVDDSPHIESDYEDEYFSHLSSIESGEESEQESEKFRETEKILREIAKDKKTPQNLPKSTSVEPAGRSSNCQRSPAKARRKWKRKITPIKGKNVNRKRAFQMQNKRGT
ncbi:hypothetical protein JTB14_025163 [Gonioctena quinquepunctata]|nr:hypothetical protein JTB14_025163 [Gonioctena quinquepunctata]